MPSHFDLVRKNFKKPAVEKITMLGHDVKCACGTAWFAAIRATNSDGTVCEDHPDPRFQECPDCKRKPGPGAIGALTERVYDIPIVITNIAPDLLRGLVRPPPR